MWFLLLLIVVHPQVAGATSGDAEVVLRPLDTGGLLVVPAPSGPAIEMSCDDGTFGGTLFQRLDTLYGNRFEAACGAGQITGLTFVHYGYGLEEPYAYRLHLLDPSCRTLGVTDELLAPGAPLEPRLVEVDLSAYRWCVSGDFYLLLEPLTCADGRQGQDCFPALVVDASSDPDAGTHCASVSTQTAAGRECFVARSADGRSFDFRLRVQLLCRSELCLTPVTPCTWSTVKRLYHDPTAASTR